MFRRYFWLLLLCLIFADANSLEITKNELPQKEMNFHLLKPIVANIYTKSTDIYIPPQQTPCREGSAFRWELLQQRAVRRNSDWIMEIFLHSNPLSLY
jgi:hypothetical protein